MARCSRRLDHEISRDRQAAGPGLPRPTPLGSGGLGNERCGPSSACQTRLSRTLIDMIGGVSSSMKTGSPESDSIVMLDAEECERARMRRDRRYDGRFFSGVRTTRIYCRPVCPVRPAHGKNVTFYL